MASSDSPYSGRENGLTNERSSSYVEEVGITCGKRRGRARGTAMEGGYTCLKSPDLEKEKGEGGDEEKRKIESDINRAEFSTKTAQLELSSSLSLWDLILFLFSRSLFPFLLHLASRVSNNVALIK